MVPSHSHGCIAWSLFPPLVYRSVEPLFESSRFDDGLKQLIRDTFPEFYPQGSYVRTYIIKRLLYNTHAVPSLFVFSILFFL